MMKYDFIVFENYHQAFNHKFDVKLIAKLLMQAGLKVAMLDIYHEDKGDYVEGIPILHLRYQHSIPHDQYRSRNFLQGRFCRYRFLIQQHFYMKNVWKEIEPLADKFYCGSYHLTMSSVSFGIKKPCYYWGLRSSRMTDFWLHFKQSHFYAFRMLFLKHKFLRNPSQCLFVSNPIIKQEFKELGIDESRLAIREERCATGLEQPEYDRLSNNFSLLTIGMLRPEKRIDFTVKEFLSASNSDNWTYTLAGKSWETYEPVISNAISGHTNVKRINEYVNYNRFYDYIRNAHFIVLADIRQPSSVTNGTMLESFICYRPVIAPNYNPYKYYIEKFGIGIMYNPDKKGDLMRAMEEAERRGVKSFEKNIREYLKTVEFNTVSRFLCQQIYGWETQQ